MEEHTILKGLREGDSKVIKGLYENAFKYCASIVTNNSGHLEDARDLFQDAIMVLFRNSQKKDFKLTCKVKTYLYSVMRNLWLKQIDKEGRGGLKLIVDDDDRPLVIVEENEVEAREEKERKYKSVTAALDLIKEDCKKLLLDFYFKKMDLGSIAEEMGYTYQFIKVKKNRCMNALKEKVGHLNI